MDDVALLKRAVALAAEARDAGNQPFGALLADQDGTVVLTARNTVISDFDVTAHAETNLVRLASRTLGRFLLAPLTLYSSAEPCAMCAGAIYWSGLERVVYALAEEELLELTGDDPDNPTLDLACRQVFAAGQRPIEVVGPVDLREARDVHRDFWRP